MVFFVLVFVIRFTNSYSPLGLARQLFRALVESVSRGVWVLAISTYSSGVVSAQTSDLKRYVFLIFHEFELDSARYGGGPAVRSERVHERIVAVSLAMRLPNIFMVPSTDCDTEATTVLGLI